MTSVDTGSIFSDEVVTGFWLDHGRSSIFRARLTLTSNASNLLLIGLAVLTTLTGEYLWQIICQIIFLRRATDLPKDALFHQIQLSLRNNDSPAEFSWNTFRLSAAWAKRSSSLRWRPLRWTLFGLLMLAITNTSSFWLPVLSTEGEVLLRAPLYTEDDSASQALYADDPVKKLAYSAAVMSELQLRDGSQAKQSQSYADSCYPSITNDVTFYVGGTKMCDTYARPHLDYTVSFPGECPFADGLCSVPPDQVISLDTGKINSHDDLGLNTPPDTRVEVQSTLTCAPIHTEGHVSPNYTAFNNVSDALIYHYGPSDLAESKDLMSFPLHDVKVDRALNITYYDLKSAEDTRYPLIATTWQSEDWLEGFEPGKPRISSFNLSSDLRKSDAPVTLIFLRNHLSSNTPINDPWFNMTTAWTSPLYNDSYYRASKPSSVLGCSQSTAFCNPAKGKCLNVDRIQAAEDGANNDAVWDALGFDSQQHRWLANFMIRETRALAIGEYAFDKSDALLLDRTFNTYNHGWLTISDNYWQSEVRYWMNRLLAIVQVNIMQNVEYPLFEMVKHGTIRPLSTDAEDYYLAHIVKVRSHSHQSFSVAALAFIVIFQSLIIFGGLYMQFIWPWLRLRNLDDSPHQYRRYKMWQLMGAVQLHRCLHQLLGRGKWRGAWHQIPTTEPKSTFCEYGKLPWQPYVSLEQERERSGLQSGETEQGDGGLGYSKESVGQDRKEPINTVSIETLPER